jgi:ATP-dependent Clp protease protease subunit
MFREPVVRVETNSGSRGIAIEDYMYNDRCIWIQGKFECEVADSVMAQLKILEENYIEVAKDTVVTIYINSYGGDVYGGLNLYNYMLHTPLRIHTCVTGFAGSIASILFLAGEERRMLPYSRVHIHEPGKNLFSDKSIDGLDGVVNDLHYYKDVITNIIADRTNLTADEIDKMITNRNQYFNAQEALENGFATRIVNGL